MGNDLAMVAVFPRADSATEYHARLTETAEGNFAADITLDGQTVAWTYDKAAHDRAAARNRWTGPDMYEQDMREHVGYWGTSPDAYYGLADEFSTGGVATLNGQPCPPSF